MYLDYFFFVIYSFRYTNDMLQPNVSGKCSDTDLII